MISSSRPLALLLAGALLTACHSEPQEAQAPPPPPAPKPVQYPTGPDSATAAAALPRQRALSHSVGRHVFSTARDRDRFDVQLLGDSVRQATVRFCIVAATGDTLWREQFPAAALLPRRLRQAPAARQQEYILAQFRSFLAPPQFLTPAVPAGAPAPGPVQAATWAELQQTGLPAFRYALGDAPARRLAYLPSQRKAVAY